MVAAREIVHDPYVAGKPKSFDDLHRLVKHSADALLGLDRSFKVESDIFVRFKHTLAMLPSETNPSTMQEVLSTMQALRAQEVCVFSDTSAHRAVDVMADLVSGMVEVISPEGEFATGGDMCSQALSALAHLFASQVRRDGQRWLAILPGTDCSGRVRAEFREDPGSALLGSCEQFQRNKRLLCADHCRPGAVGLLRFSGARQHW